MSRLLVVHHTPSPSTRALLEAVLDWATDDAIDGAIRTGAGGGSGVEHRIVKRSVRLTIDGETSTPRSRVPSPCENVAAAS